MNKIKQNKITFTLILAAIVIIFSSLTILSLPVLFNYKSKVTIIEKNFYKNFKFYLKSNGKISYKPFPKPHLMVENASLNLVNPRVSEDLIKTSNLKIFLSLRDVYLRSFNNFISTEISKSNLEIKLDDLKELRRHLYMKVNKDIVLNDCKIFLKNKNDEVILISPSKKITYKINNKTKIKNLSINGDVFGLNFKSEWKRNYNTPKTSFHNIDIYNPIIEIKNIFSFENSNSFQGQSQIVIGQDKLKYNIEYNKEQINISSPDKDNTNFNINSKIELNPFYFEGGITIKNKKIDNIIDNFLPKLLLYDENFLGNLNGVLKIYFDKLNNKLIKNGELEFVFNEKKIDFKFGFFDIHKIGNLKTEISFKEEQGKIKFISKNQVNIENHIEFAKLFQVSSRKVKNIKQIYFDLEKIVEQDELTIKNVRINNIKNNKIIDEIFLVKNIQNLRSHVRKLTD